MFCGWFKGGVPIHPWMATYGMQQVTMGVFPRPAVPICGVPPMTGWKPDPMVVKTPFMGYVLGNPGKHRQGPIAPKLQVVQGFPQLALGLGEVW